MKRILIFIVSFTLLLLMAGCNRASNAGSVDTKPLDAESASPDTDEETSEPMPVGTVETFTYGNFVLEISNVCEIRTDTGVFDNGEPYEFPVYICYPGATLRVVNADMSDPTYAEDHQAHPQWGVYNVETDSRMKLTDDMEPIALDETTDAVFNLEASLFVLKFEFAE